MKKNKLFVSFLSSLLVATSLLTPQLAGAVENSTYSASSETTIEAPEPNIQEPIAIVEESVVSAPEIVSESEVVSSISEAIVSEPITSIEKPTEAPVEAAGTSSTVSQVAVTIVSRAPITGHAKVIANSVPITSAPASLPTKTVLAQSTAFYGKNLLFFEKILTSDNKAFYRIQYNNKPGYIAATALDIKNALTIVSTKNVSYNASINNSVGALTNRPGGLVDNIIISYLGKQVGKTVPVHQEATLSNGKVFLKVTLDGYVGWLPIEATRVTVTSTTKLSPGNYYVRDGAASIMTRPKELGNSRAVSSLNPYKGNKVILYELVKLSTGQEYYKAKVGTVTGYIPTSSVADGNTVVNSKDVNKTAYISKSGYAITSAAGTGTVYTNSSNLIDAQVTKLKEVTLLNGNTYFYIRYSGNKLGYVAKEALSDSIATSGANWKVTNGGFYVNNAKIYNLTAKTYIIVSIANQRVWGIKNGQKILDVPVITGRPGMDTPRGFYNLNGNRQSPSVLVGADYRAPVAYWAPFIGNMYGFHDANWQNWGNYNVANANRYYGSHGCVNMRTNDAAVLYRNFGVGVPVIIY